MPELPDIEGYRLVLAEQLTGSRVVGVQVLDPGVLRNTTAEAFHDRLVGCRFLAPRRHGKWLILPTDGPTLLIHSGMTGRPYFAAVGSTTVPETDSNDRLVITTDHGELRYADLRKLRGVWIVNGSAEVPAVTGEQGPDALDIAAKDFRAALAGHHGALKPTLMNQRVIAGLGNMLSDELCWRARLHPARPVNSLDDNDLRRLYQVLQRTLRAAVTSRRIPRTRAWLSSTRGRENAPCPRCGTALQHSRISGRSSIWCPQCQPAQAGL